MNDDRRNFPVAAPAIAPPDDTVAAAGMANVPVTNDPEMPPAVAGTRRRPTGA